MSIRGPEAGNLRQELLSGILRHIQPYNLKVVLIYTETLHIDVAAGKDNSLRFELLLLRKGTAERKTARAETFRIDDPVTGGMVIARVLVQGVPYVAAQVTVTRKGGNLGIRCNLAPGYSTDSGINLLGEGKLFHRRYLHVPQKYVGKLPPRNVSQTAEGPDRRRRQVQHLPAGKEAGQVQGNVPAERGNP